MFAPVPVKQIQSQINLLFGQKPAQQKTPIALEIVFDVFSQKVPFSEIVQNQNDRFVLQILLGCSISDDTLLVEIQANNGNGTGLADKIMTFVKTNKNYAKLNQQDKVQIKALGNGNTCYVFINTEKLLSAVKQISKTCQQLQQQKASQSNLNHEIKLQVKSSNDCGYIRKLLDNQGAMRAFFDSLWLNITFQKTNLVQKVLEKILTQLQLQTLVGPLKSFNNLNLSLKFASASQIEKYPQVLGIGKIVNKIETSFLAAIKGEFKDQIKFTYFNPVFSFWGGLVARDIESVLEALFEEPDNNKS